MASFNSSKQFKFIEKIGSGGFGEVFSIKAKTNGRYYAVKIVNINRLKNSNKNPEHGRLLLKMALREATEMMKALPNEHIVEVYGSFIEGSQYYMVMELCDPDATLKQVIVARFGKMFEETQIRRWAAQLAIILKYLHSKKILHGDVKAENIFLTPKRTLKLGDFSIARTFDGTSSAHLIIGTTTHLAPELFGGDDEISDPPAYNEKAEMWALGVLLYEIAALYLPFPPSKNVASMLHAICKKPISPIKTPISPELRHFIEAELLNRDPVKRLSMAQVLEHRCLANVMAAGPFDSQPEAKAPLEPNKTFKRTWSKSRFKAHDYRFFSRKGSKRIRSKKLKVMPEIFEAAEKGDLIQVRNLVHLGADINAKNDKDAYGKTPLIYAALNGHYDIVTLLVERGAKIDEPSKGGSTPLISAAFKGHQEISAYLIYRGAKVDVTNSSGDTALSKAARQGHRDIVSLLIYHGANVDAADEDGWTPLIFAARNGHRDTAALLLDRSANVNATSKDGWSPLLAAVWNGHRHVASLLLFRGAKVDQPNKEGWTPLIAAIRNNNEEMALLLMSYSAKIDLANNVGWTPLIFAARNGFYHLVDLLVDYGANVNAADKDGWTPLYVARRHGHREVVNLLIEHGARQETPV